MAETAHILLKKEIDYNLKNRNLDALKANYCLKYYKLRNCRHRRVVILKPRCQANGLKCWDL